MTNTSRLFPSIRPPRLSVWPPLRPGSYGWRPTASVPFPLGEPGYRLFGWGRRALVAGIRSLGLGAGDGVLVPAYHHGSEVAALRSTGVACRFYDATETLEPDDAELDHLLDPGVRALHLIHYLGFPQDSARWRRWCDERELLLIEDAAQAWLSRLPGGPVGSFGDASIFCLYKSVGLPEGAALVSTAGVPDPGVDPRLGAAALTRRHAAWIAQRSGLAATVAAGLAR